MQDQRVDLFVLKHMYGLAEAKKFDDYHSDPELTAAVQSNNILVKKNTLHSDRRKIRKVSDFGIFFGLLKGYCALSLLVFPKAFSNGGYLFSPIVLIFFMGLTICTTNMLVKCGVHTRFLSYTSIVRIALGPMGKHAGNAMLVLTQFSFSISFTVFILDTT